MKVYIDQYGNIEKVLDNVFVANSTTYDNTMTWYFVNSSGEVYENTEVSYCSMYCKRSDGHLISRINCPLETTDEGKGYKYTCTQYDGILLVAGALEISAQFVKATIEDDEITSREVLCTTVVEGHVKKNYGIADEEYFNDVLEQAMLDRDTLQSQITALSVSCVPSRLSVLPSLDTSSNRENVLLYCDNNGTKSKISMKDMFGLLLRTGTEVPSDMQTGEYLFLEIQ